MLPSTWNENENGKLHTAKRNTLGRLNRNGIRLAGTRNIFEMLSSHTNLYDIAIHYGWMDTK